MTESIKTRKAPTVKGKKDSVRDKRDGVMKGVRIWKNPRNRFAVFQLHYTADPGKNPETEEGKEWYGITRSSQASDAAWQQEYEINFAVSTGRIVFPQFKEVWHTGESPWHAGFPVLEGLDFGTHHPCWVWAQENTMLNRFEILECALGWEIDFPTFADQCMQLRSALFPDAIFKTYCDRHGAMKNAQGLRHGSGVDNPVDYLFNVHGVAANWLPYSEIHEGLDLIRKKMAKTDEGFGFFVNKTPEREVYKREPNTRIVFGTGHVIEALSGGYFYPKKRDGSYGDKPTGQGYYDHAMDAIRMIVANHFRQNPHGLRDRSVPHVSNISYDEYGLGF